MGIFQRIRRFMEGRYGIDALNIFLAALMLLVWLVNVFVWNRPASWILFGIELALMTLVILRMLSRNFNRRSLENRRFRAVYDPVKNWIALQFKKFRGRKEYKYLKCPHCKAQLRVKNQKGEHGVRCPKCRNEFQVKI